MRKVFVLAICAGALACSDQTAQQTGPSTVPPSIPPPPSRVVLSGRVYAAASGGPDHFPIGSSLSARVLIVEGVNAGRETSSAYGGYKLADLEPGTMTLAFSTSGYQGVRRTVEVRADTRLDIGLEPGPWPGFVLSGLITTQWGEPIDDVGVEAVHDGRVLGGGTARNGLYRIPTLPATDYTVRAIKWGYVTPQRSLTLTSDTTLDFVLDRVRVSIFGVVSEAPPCTGAVQDARVEIVSGPDAGIGASSTASGYQLKNINWGRFRLRAAKTGYVAAEVSMDVLSPGSKGEFQELPAPLNVRQDFRLQRTGSC